MRTHRGYDDELGAIQRRACLDASASVLGVEATTGIQFADSVSVMGCPHNRWCLWVSWRKWMPMRGFGSSSWVLSRCFGQRVCLN